MQCKYSTKRRATGDQPPVICFNPMSPGSGHETVIESGLEDIKRVLSCHLVWLLWPFCDPDRRRDREVREGGVRDM